MRGFGVAAASIAVMTLLSIAPALAGSRLALVIANSAYQSAPPIATAAADAGLIASALQADGFDVTRSDDLTTQNFGDAIGTFIGKVQAAGPDAIVFVYFSGYAVQANGDDHLVPVDAQINTAASVPDMTLPLSALTKALGDVPSAARIIVLDAARDGNFGKAGGQPVAPGLALATVPAGFLLAYSAAPDSYAPAVSGTNSPYATALATLLAQPGLDIEQVFKGVRLQVNQASSGAQLPWTSSGLDSDVMLVAAAPAAPPPRTLAPALGVAGIAVPPPKRRHITKASMRRMSGDEAYDAAIAQDSLRDYQWFVETHPDYPRVGQIWNSIENRREGILWGRTLRLDSTRAYWNYLDRYPDGAHADLARSVLADRGEPLPSNYVAVPLDLPPGYSDEAMGLPDLVPYGYDQPADVFFGSPDPEFVPAPTDGSINFNFNFGKKRRDRDRAAPNPNPLPPNPSPLPVVGPNTNPLPPNPNPLPPNPSPLPVVGPDTNPLPPNPSPLPVVGPNTNPLPPNQRQATSTNCVNGATHAQLSGCLDELGKIHDKRTDDMQKAILKQLDEQTKKKAAEDTKKAAEAAAAEKAALGPDKPPVLMKSNPNQPNRWQTFLNQKCASQTGMTQADRDRCKNVSKSNKPQTPAGQKPFMEFSTKQNGTTTSPSASGASTMSGISADQGGELDEAGSGSGTGKARSPISKAVTQSSTPRGKPSGLTIPSKSAGQPQPKQPVAAIKPTAPLNNRHGLTIPSKSAAQPQPKQPVAAIKPTAPLNNRHGLTIPSKRAEQPRIVMPPPTNEQKRLSNLVQQRLKAREEAEKRMQPTKSGGLTIPSKSAAQPQPKQPVAAIKPTAPLNSRHGLTIPSKRAEQPRIVMPPPTNEQKRLSNLVQQRLKAREEAEKRMQPTKSGGLTIPSKSAAQPQPKQPVAAIKPTAPLNNRHGLTIPSKRAEQPRIVMPPPTNEQKRLSNLVQQRLKAREEAEKRTQPTKSGGLTIPSSSQRQLQAGKLQQERVKQQQAQQRLLQQQTQQKQQQRAPQKLQQERARQQQLQQQQAQQKLHQEQERAQQQAQERAKQQTQQRTQQQARERAQQQAQERARQQTQQRTQQQARERAQQQAQERARQQTQQRTQQQARERAQQQAQQRRAQVRQVQQRQMGQRSMMQRQMQQRRMQRPQMQQRQMQQRQMQQRAMMQRQMQQRRVQRPQMQQRQMMQRQIMQQHQAQGSSCRQFMNGRCVR